MTVRGFKELTSVSIASGLSVLFGAPLFGMMAEIEPGKSEKHSFPGRSKILCYLVATLAGLGVFVSLNRLTAGGIEFGRFGVAQVSSAEVRWFIPIALAGVIAGLLYHILGKAFAVLPVARYPVAFAVGGGLVLGVFAMFLPVTLFSGEAELFALIEHGPEFSPGALIAVGLAKLVLTVICLHTGWRGGHIFPLLFTGAALGYGLASLSGIDPVFAVAVVMATLCGVVMRKPLTVILLLLICFPIENLVILTLGAAAGALVPLPKLRHEEQVAPIEVERNLAPVEGERNLAPVEVERSQ